MMMMIFTYVEAPDSIALSGSGVLGSLLTVYMSKLVQGGSTTIYRFSLNTSVPSPWKVCSTEHDEVSSFQVWAANKVVFIIIL